MWGEKEKTAGERGGGGLIPGVKCSPWCLCHLGYWFRDRQNWLSALVFTLILRWLLSVHPVSATMVVNFPRIPKPFRFSGDGRNSRSYLGPSALAKPSAPSQTPTSRDGRLLDKIPAWPRRVSLRSGGQSGSRARRKIT